MTMMITHSPEKAADDTAADSSHFLAVSAAVDLVAEAVAVVVSVALAAAEVSVAAVHLVDGKDDLKL